MKASDQQISQAIFRVVGSHNPRPEPQGVPAHVRVGNNYSYILSPNLVVDDVVNRRGTDTVLLG